MSNHVVIGLGGTGGNTILALRKKVFQNIKTSDPEEVNLRYLYLDTSDELLDGGESKWRVLGRSVALPQSSKMMISGIDLRKVLDAPHHFPGISPWLGDRGDYEDVVRAAEAAQRGAGQRRRLGRLLFAANARDFIARVELLVKQMQDNPAPKAEHTGKITFHLCFGLAGGTGSGSIVDVIHLIRRTWRQDEVLSYKILLYGVLPEQRPGKDMDPTGYYHANAYAALRELNAVAVGAWHPHDVTGLSRERLNVQNPFDACFLFGDENSRGVHVNVTTQTPEIIASYLFQRILESTHTQFDEQAMIGVDAFENAPGGGFAERDATNREVRSTRFFTLGIKQVCYPQTEIREYVAYTFAQQAVRQMTFNHWDAGVGYKDEAANVPVREWVRSPPMQNRWKISEEYVTLSKGILPEEDANALWKPIDDFWRTTINKVEKDILDRRTPAPQRLIELDSQCDKLYRVDYRKHGVQRFYAVKAEGDRRAQVSALREGIERELFTEWLGGTRSLADLRLAVEELIDLLNERREEFDAKIADHEPGSLKADNLRRRIKEQFQKYADVSVAGAVMGHRDRILQTQVQNYIGLYTMQTYVEGWRYGRVLVLELAQSLTSLLTAIKDCITSFRYADDQVEAALASRCRDVEGDPLAKAVVLEYEPARVREFAHTMAVNPDLQKTQAGTVRNAIAAELLDRKEFSELRDRINGGTLLEILERSCVAAADSVGNDERDGMLRIRVIDKLKAKFRGQTERLDAYWKDILTLADLNLNFGGTDRVRQTEANSLGTMTHASFCILPDAPRDPDFLRELKASLQRSSAIKMQVATNWTRPHEITLVKVCSKFAVRNALVLPFLEGHYQRKLSGSDAARNYIALHLEGTVDNFPQGESLPALTPETYTAEKMRPYALMALTLGALREEEDPKDGRRAIYLYRLDRNGLTETEKMASSLDDLIRGAGEKPFLMLREYVQEQLAGEYLHRTRREDLLAGVKARLSTELALPASHERYQEARRALEATMNILDLEVSHAR